jgi:prefoldin subunit 5
MPGPTAEILNEDVKELKGNLRDIRSSIEVLKADAHRIDIGLAELRAEFRFAKWLLGLLLAMTLVGVGGGISMMSRIDTKVSGFESRFERLEDTQAKILELIRTSLPPQAARPATSVP